MPDSSFVIRFYDSGRTIIVFYGIIRVPVETINPCRQTAQQRIGALPLGLDADHAAVAVGVQGLLDDGAGPSLSLVNTYPETPIERVVTGHATDVGKHRTADGRGQKGITELILQGFAGDGVPASGQFSAQRLAALRQQLRGHVLGFVFLVRPAMYKADTAAPHHVQQRLLIRSVQPFPLPKQIVQIAASEAPTPAR